MATIEDRYPPWLNTAIPIISVFVFLCTATLSVLCKFEMKFERQKKVILDTARHRIRAENLAPNLAGRAKLTLFTVHVELMNNMPNVRFAESPRYQHRYENSGHISSLDNIDSGGRVNGTKRWTSIDGYSRNNDKPMTEQTGIVETVIW